MNNIVQGLCQTDQWKRSLSFLNEIGETSRSAQTMVAEKAFSVGEIDLGFQLLEETVFDGFKIHPNVCAAYWEFCRCHGKHVAENIERMLKYLESKEVILTRTCVEKLHAVIAEFGSSGRFAQVNKRYITLLLFNTHSFIEN